MPIMKFWIVTLVLLNPATQFDWIALAKNGFVVPPGRTAVDMLVEMNPLLASTDPVLRDDVAFSAAERWIVRDRRLSPADLRTVLQMWKMNLDDGIGSAGDDRVFRRSFSALSLSLVAAADLSSPFLDAGEVQAFFDRMLLLFQACLEELVAKPVKFQIQTVMFLDQFDRGGIDLWAGLRNLAVLIEWDFPVEC
jgi:hypothetical protein